MGNEYGRPKDVAGENRYAFTSHADSSFDVCFENILTARMSEQFHKAYVDRLAKTTYLRPHIKALLWLTSVNFPSTEKDVTNPNRHIELDIDIGADAKDWSAIQAGEKLKPVETELRRIEELVAEIVSEMDYLRQREQKLRDTNESTNERVKWFAFGTMGMLVGLGAWQVVYLRAYFRSVHVVVTVSYC